MILTDAFLMDYKALFMTQTVEVGMKTDNAWTGRLDRADATGLWLSEEADGGPRVTWIPWEAVEYTTCPPLPEEKE